MLVCPAKDVRRACASDAAAASYVPRSKYWSDEIAERERGERVEQEGQALGNAHFCPANLERA
jgi:hypothetical protein